MNWWVSKKINYGFAVALATLAAISAGSGFSLFKLRDGTNWVKHTQEVLIESENLISILKDAETGQRGYLLTGDLRYLEPYQSAIEVIELKIKHLQQLTSDNPNQQKRLDAIESLSTAKLTELKQTIALRQQKGLPAALEVVRTHRGKQIMDELRQILSEVEKEENFLLQARSRQEKYFAQTANILVGSSSFLAFFLLAWTTLLVNRDIWQGKQTQEQLRKKEREETLKESEEKFRQLAENIHEVFWMAKPDKSQILYVSPAYEQIWGRRCESLYAAPLSFLEAIHPDDRDRVVAAGDKQIRGEYDEEYRILRPDGEIRWIRDRAFPVKNDRGEIYRVVGIAEDISDRKKLEEVLLQHTAKLEQANHIKDEFLAVTSHELRTPLNAMLGWASLLRSRKLDEKTTARALEVIERNAKSQSQLIEDLLDISRMIRGQIRLDFQAIDLKNAIEAAVDTVRSSADAKGIELETALETTQCIVSADANRVQQVVWNLLSNAVKFTPAGGRVKVSLLAVMGDSEREKPDSSAFSLLTRPIPKYAQIEVIDTGKGISPDFLPHVFDRFSQADGNGTRSSTGLGLGLPIARQLVELHGGKIYADLRFGTLQSVGNWGPRLIDSDS